MTRRWVFLLLTSCVLLLVSLVAQNPTLSFLKTLKILELIFLGFYVSKKVRFWTSQNDERSIKLSTIISLLSITVFLESVLAIWQFLKQGSVGGSWWLWGERTFNSSTPFISQAIINGQLILRSYGTFPHPNVLGGYLAIVLPLIIFFGCHCEPRFNRGVAISLRGFLRLRSLSRAVIKRDCFTSVRNDSERSLLAMTRYGLKIFLLTTLILGLIALFLTFSRTAWLVFGMTIPLLVIPAKAGIHKNNLYRFPIRSGMTLTIMIVSILTTILLVGGVVFSRFQTLEDVDKKSLVIRQQLNASALKIISDHPVFGVGLNNFLVILPRYWQTTGAVRFYQPAHNIFLLIAAETGLIGLFLFLGFIFLTVHRILATRYYILLLLLLEILFLGLFDHYFYTLQQTQLLLSLVLGLAWKKKT